MQKHAVIKSVKKQSYLIYLLPALAFYVIFLVYPIISSFQLSFFSWDGINGIKKFVGMMNYRDIFTDDIFKDTIKNTLLCVLIGPVVQTSLALALAVMISNTSKVRAFYRAVFYTPVILPLVAASIVWFVIYNPTFGILNSIIRLFGFQDYSQAWLGDTRTALLAVLVISIWRWTGFNIVIFMAGLQNISMEYYEAARIDGANRFQTFRNITIPMLSSSIIINFALNLIGYLKLFDVIFVTTKGGPAYATNVIPIYIYNQAFQYNSIGTASAASVILFLMIAMFSGVYFWSVRRTE